MYSCYYCYQYSKLMLFNKCDVIYCDTLTFIMGVFTIFVTVYSKKKIRQFTNG